MSLIELKQRQILNESLSPVVNLKYFVLVVELFIWKDNLSARFLTLDKFYVHLPQGNEFFILFVSQPLTKKFMLFLFHF